MLAFTVGSAAVHQLAELPSVVALYVALPVMCVIAILCFKFDHSRLFLSVLAVVAGLLLTAYSASQRLNERLPLDNHATRADLSGYIDSVLISKKGYARFVLKTSSFPDQIERRVRLGWYYKSTDRLPKAGEYWQISAKLFIPRGFSNPGGMDYERWLFQENIAATGYVKGGAQRLSVASDVSVDAFRQQVTDRIRSTLEANSSLSAKAIIVALAVGERGYLSDNDWQLLSATGTSHLVAISGLHVGLVAAFFIILGRLCGSRLMVHYPQIRLPVVGAMFAVVGACAYAALAGWSIPTQRALIMVVVYAFAVMLRRTRPALDAVIIALCLVLVVDPLATLNKGLWLSFGAVAIIIYATEGRMKQYSLLAKMFYVQLMLSFVLAPLVMLFFGSLSLVSPLANMVLIPFYSLVVVPLVLLGVLLDTLAIDVFGCWQLAAYCIDLSLRFLNLLDSFIWSAVEVATPSLASTLFLLAGLLLLTSPLRRSLRVISVVFILPIITEQVKAPLNQGEFELTVLDVGQGLANVVRTKNHILLYDAGPRFRSGTDTGAIVVLPYLRSLGVRRIDALVLSHDDIDHTGGAASVASKVAVGQRYTSFSGSGESCHAAKKWQWDGVTFEFISILNEGAYQALSDNNRSCILHVSSGSGSLLLPGDIEVLQETRVLAVLHNVDVVVMPHHGSKSSSSGPFIEALQAKLAIASTGYRNRYHFPHSQVVQRYQANGAEVLNTAADGAIKLHWRDGGVQKLFRWRLDGRRYWNQP